jgi:transglutaminase-like putative cysteine protease
VFFLPDYETVLLSYQLTQQYDTVEEKIAVLYAYVTSTITYDGVKANKVLTGEIKFGYLPDADRTLKEKQGICYDYAALLGALLRAQGIPTKLVTGIAFRDNSTIPEYHAWNEVWNGTEWILLDPTLDRANPTDQIYEKEFQY